MHVVISSCREGWVYWLWDLFQYTLVYPHVEPGNVTIEMKRVKRESVKSILIHLNDIIMLLFCEEILFCRKYVLPLNWLHQHVTKQTNVLSCNKIVFQMILMLLNKFLCRILYHVYASSSHIVAWNTCVWYQFLSGLGFSFYTIDPNFVMWYLFLCDVNWHHSVWS